MTRRGLPVSLCIARMLHIELGYENEARLQGGDVVRLDRAKVVSIGGETRLTDILSR